MNIENEDQLDTRPSEPWPRLVEMMGRLHGDLIILGVAGKIGVTLALTAKRAANEAGANRRIVGVARFSNLASRHQLEQAGIETITCDLVARDTVARLPALENVV